MNRPPHHLSDADRLLLGAAADYALKLAQTFADVACGFREFEALVERVPMASIFFSASIVRENSVTASFADDAEYVRHIEAELDYFAQTAGVLRTLAGQFEAAAAGRLGADYLRPLVRHVASNLLVEIERCARRAEAQPNPFISRHIA